jgi:hypothetical protein
VDKDQRASLVAAGAAAALSVLVGAIAGVGFLTIILRALLGGLVIGAAVYGGIILLRKLVPGLLDGSADAAEDDSLSGEDALRGSNVDIVLPGEAASPEAFASADEASQRYYSEAPSAFAAAKGGFGAGTPDEEATEISPVDDASLLESEGPSVEPIAAVPSSVGREGGRRPSTGFEDLDILPDLEGFSDSFAASEFSSGGSSGGSPVKGYQAQGGSGQKQGQDGMDPAALAQAVRTILKRDQKG